MRTIKLSHIGMLLCMQMHTFALQLRLTLCRNNSCQDAGKDEKRDPKPCAFGSIFPSLPASWQLLLRQKVRRCAGESLRCSCALSFWPAGNCCAQWQPWQLLFFCCSTIGARSGKYAQQLVDQGVPQVYNLEGSIIAWVSL